MRDTKDILRAWNDTETAERVFKDHHLGYSSVQLTGAPARFDRRRYLDNAEMQIVKNALDALKEDDPTGYEVLINMYAKGRSCTKQARSQGKRPKIIIDILHGAEKQFRGLVYHSFKSR